VVDQPTHMALELRRILGHLSSLKLRFRGNIHWYVEQAAKDLVCFEEKYGLLTAERVLHALILPHLIEGKEPSLESWRKDLHLKGKLGEMVYGTYREIAPEIPRLVREVTRHQQTVAQAVWHGAPMPLKEYRAMSGMKEGSESVNFATQDSAPTCAGCGHRHHGPRCLKETNAKRALDEIGPLFQALKTLGADLTRANKITNSGDQKRAIDALIARFDGSVVKIERAAGGGRNTRGPIGERAKVLVVEEQVLAVEPKKPPMHIGTFKDRLAEKKFDPRTCYGHAVYGSCTRDGCAFVHDRAMKGILPVGGKPSGGGADGGVKTRSATRAVGKTGAAPKQPTTRTVPGSKCAAPGGDKPRRVTEMPDGSTRNLSCCSEECFNEVKNKRRTESVSMAVEAGARAESPESEGDTLSGVPVTLCYNIEEAGACGHCVVNERSYAGALVGVPEDLCIPMLVSRWGHMTQALRSAHIQLAAEAKAKQKRMARMIRNIYLDSAVIVTRDGVNAAVMNADGETRSQWVRVPVAVEVVKKTAKVPFHRPKEPELIPETQNLRYYGSMVARVGLGRAAETKAQAQEEALPIETNAPPAVEEVPPIVAEAQPHVAPAEVYPVGAGERFRRGSGSH
jgi:hypothetical protein